MSYSHVVALLLSTSSVDAVLASGILSALDAAAPAIPIRITRTVSSHKSCPAGKGWTMVCE